MPGCTTLPDRMSCAMHEGLCARACMRVRGWGVASESTGMVVRGGEGVLEVEGVPGAAACSLLLHLGWVYDAKPLPLGILEISGASDLDQDKIDVILSW